MNSNQANESDGSYHIRVEPKKKPAPVQKPQEVEIKKEVKHDKQKSRK